MSIVACCPVPTPPAHDPARRGVSIRRPGGGWEWRQASILLHDFAEWILAAGGVDVTVEQPAFALELADLASAYDGDRADMFVAFDDGLAVGTVAVRYHDDARAELKRMYVRSAYRGRGIADDLVASAVRAATARSCATIWLETLQGAMDPAIRLYRRHGFVDSPHRGTLEVDGIVVMERPLRSGADVR
jgi:GNAT superfamily N-acetyltransferase